MNRRFVKVMAATTLAIGAAATLGHGVALADDVDDNDIDQYSKDYDHARKGGDGAKGGQNKAECLAPLGLSLGAIASTGGNVDQCNSRGGNGGNGGAGDVDY